VRNLADRNAKRGDLEVMLGLEAFLVDVTIRNNTAASQLVAHDPERAIRNAEREKNNKYEEECELNNMTMVPFAVDVYGNFGSEAIEFANKVADFARRDNPTMDYNVRDRLLNNFSITLQRYNARMLNRAIQAHKMESGQEQNARREPAMRADAVRDAVSQGVEPMTDA